MTIDRTKSLKVAMLAPLSWRTPPRHYGPWELVVSLIAEGLVERGVDVTLFATADSVTRAKLAAVCPRPLSEDPSLDAKVWECLHVSRLFERAAEFDLIHNHFDFFPLSFSRLVETPVITTIHGFSGDRIIPMYEKFNDTSHYVSISLADRHPKLQYIANVYHGIDMTAFQTAAKKEDYLLFWGRIHPDKGAAEAIQLAKRTGRRLLMAGIIHDERYFESEVQPHVDGRQVEYLGSVGPDRRADLLGRAQALVHLINFEEPFGLSVVEAMACGTPVLATPRGSMPEIIMPGVNGVLVRDLDEAADSLETLAGLDPAAIRSSVENRFSRERMVEEYLEVYRKVVRRR